MRAVRTIFLFLSIGLLGGCGFHLRGETPVAPPLQRLYLQTQDPYGDLARDIRQYMKSSNITLVNSPLEAATILEVLREDHNEQLVSIGGSQLTRQYNLVLSVNFQINSPQGVTLVPPQAVSETRSITIQSNQILGGSNEETNLYQQMRRAIVFDIMSRLSSTEVSQLVTEEKPLKKPVPTK